MPNRLHNLEQPHAAHEPIREIPVDEQEALHMANSGEIDWLSYARAHGTEAPQDIKDQHNTVPEGPAPTADQLRAR